MNNSNVTAIKNEDDLSAENLANKVVKYEAHSVRT
ncbi:hypothetical protein Salpa_4251 [Sporomusa sp. KB1]|nr:hypothetical protein Salpa_4251 [Sporomusa sp. KB1]